MNKLRLCYLFLLQHFDTTSAAPASDALGLTLFPSPANPSSNSSHTTHLALPNSPPFTNTVIYPIGDSTITLLLNPREDRPIPPDDLGTCLLSTVTHVLGHLRQHGDGPLAGDDNPFKSDPLPNVNCTFAVRSWHGMTPQGRTTYLTYGMVYTVLRGLLDYMLFPDPHYYFISFTVRDDQMGPVGAGSIGTVHK